MTNPGIKCAGSAAVFGSLIVSFSPGPSISEQ